MTSSRINSAAAYRVGVWPEPLYALLPLDVKFKPYTGYHVVEMLQLLLFSGLAFFVLLPFMKRTLTISLDIDWFWRRLGARLAREFTTRGNRARGLTAERLQDRMAKALETVFHFHGPKGILARTWDTGATTLLIVGLLAAYLVVYFL